MFGVPLSESGCEVNLYYLSEDKEKLSHALPQKRYTPNKKYPLTTSWISPPIIPNAEELYNEINTTTNWTRQSFVVFGTRYDIILFISIFSFARIYEYKMS